MIRFLLCLCFLVLTLGLACAETEPALKVTPLPTNTMAPLTSDQSLPAENNESSSLPDVLGRQLSSGISVADIVEQAVPSVVQVQTGSGSGTGFIIDPDGLIVTNKHVVDTASQVTVRLESGERLQGRVVRRHSELDLAYIELEAARSFTAIGLGDSDSVRVGEEIIAIGFPIESLLPGLTPTVSIGIVSAKRLNYLQTDAAINPGNSGGPLLNASGQVVGVIVSRIETDESGRPVTGIGFAIPINEVEGGQVVAAGPTATPTSSPTPMNLPTLGPTPTPTFMPTSTPRRTSTPRPSPTPSPIPTPTPGWVGWGYKVETDPVTNQTTITVARQAVEHSSNVGDMPPILTVICKGTGSEFDGSHIGILWGVPVKGASARSNYWVEAVLRWDDSPVEETLWHALRGGTWSFWVEDFVEQALSHQTVYIRITENLGKGDHFYAKFELEGLSDAIGSHRSLCEDTYKNS